MPGASRSSTARVASGVTSRGVEAGAAGGEDEIGAVAVGPCGDGGGDAAGLVGHQGALGEMVALVCRPRGDRVAGRVHALATAAGV